MEAANDNAADVLVFTGELEVCDYPRLITPDERDDWTPSWDLWDLA